MGFLVGFPILHSFLGHATQEFSTGTTASGPTNLNLVKDEAEYYGGAHLVDIVVDIREHAVNSGN